MSEQPVAVGIADHNGWAILVCVAARDGIPVVRAAQLLGVDTDQIGSFLSDIRRMLDTPWRKEHRSAAAAAIIALSQHAHLDRLHS